MSHLAAPAGSALSEGTAQGGNGAAWSPQSSLSGITSVMMDVRALAREIRVPSLHCLRRNREKVLSR